MGVVLEGAAPARPAAVRFEQRGADVVVVEAPEFAEFHTEWLYKAAQARHVTVVGLDVVVHADNGDFHYRHEADLPNGAILMRRIDP